MVSSSIACTPEGTGVEVTHEGLERAGGLAEWTRLRVSLFLLANLFLTPATVCAAVVDLGSALLRLAAGLATSSREIILSRIAWSRMNSNSALFEKAWSTESSCWRRC